MNPKPSPSERGKRRWITPEWAIAIFTAALVVVSYYQWREIRAAQADTKKLLTILDAQANALNAIASVTQSEAKTLSIQAQAQQSQAQSALRTSQMAQDSWAPRPEPITASLPRGHGIKIRNDGGNPAKEAFTTSIIGNDAEISFQHTDDIPANQTNETATRVWVFMKEQGKDRYRLDLDDNWDKVKAGFGRVIGVGRKNVCTIYRDQKQWYRAITSLSYSGDELHIGLTRFDKIKRADGSCPTK